MNDRSGPGRPRQTGDELEPLFGLAGRRPRLPEHELAPIRAAARDAWRKPLRRRAARRLVGAGLGLAAGALVAIGLLARGVGPVGTLAPADAPPAPLVGEVLVELGEIIVSGPDGTAGAGLQAGSTVETGGDGRAALRLSGGASVRIDVDSRVRLETASLVALDRGAVYVDSDSRVAHAPIVVETPLGTVRHRGTQFEVRLLDDLAPPSVSSGSPVRLEDSAAMALRVTVREGTLDVDSRGRRYQAAAGAELTLRADGSVERSSAPAHGSSWAWTQRAAPPFLIEGRTLAAFLDWVSREVALPWRYGDASLEAIAGQTILHGSIAGLGPEQALSVVLPGCGLRYRRLDRSLLLELDRRR